MRNTAPKKVINTHCFTTLRMPVRAYYRQFLLGPKCRPYTKDIEHRKIRPFVIGSNMDTVLFFLHIRGLKPLLVFYFRVEEKLAGEKIREGEISRNSICSGYLFRGRKISRKIQIREYSEHFLHAKNTCYTVTKSP